MSFYNIIRDPDIIVAQNETMWINLTKNSNNIWANKEISVLSEIENSKMHITCTTKCKLKRIKLRWKFRISGDYRFLGDHWERGYGDLEWRGIVPERVMPWYFMMYDSIKTHGYGVETGARSFCYWQVDTEGITLYLDVRSGGAGVCLGKRNLRAATIVAREGLADETPFKSTREFCKQMCNKPLMPKEIVYGSNNWYYAYGNSSYDDIIKDTELVKSLTDSNSNRPFMVIDSGWQLCDYKNSNGGPWNMGNYRFPDMEKLAYDIKALDVKPGIWFRPLLTNEMIREEWILPNNRFRSAEYGQYLDPSAPGVLEHVYKDVKTLKDWGYQLIKHDFSTYDILGRWGFEMGAYPTCDKWTFYDNTKTTAEIILGLYKKIREAAGDTIIIGCNTIGHLAAGLFEIQRTGDDTSGREWERTRKMGINTLAFRMPQHGTFFASDADCVGITSNVPWEYNKQWLELLSLSGTPLFVSADPKVLGKEEEKALKKAFDLASNPLPTGEPLDWLNNICPTKWKLNGELYNYNWYGLTGVDFMDKGVNHF